MKFFVIVFTSLILCTSVEAQEGVESDFIFETSYFSFHNNKWMNLHHFLFEQACGRQQMHLKKDGVGFKDIGDSPRLTRLSESEKELLNRGIKFYQENLIDKALLMSGKLLKWLQRQPNRGISDTSYSSEFTAILNKINPIYERHFWKRHRELNTNLFNSYKDIIVKTEASVINKMEMLSGSKWKGHVRVDLTTYGNWASAYSPDFDNIVVSAIDPMIHSSLYLEFIFHEGSHLIFTRKSPFRKSLFAQSKELGIKLPRGLWHASMFYLSGIATRDALKELDIDHEIIMKKKNVFEYYYKNEVFKSILTKYYNGTLEMDEATAALATEFKDVVR